MFISLLVTTVNAQAIADTAYPVGGYSSSQDQDVPDALSCFEVQLSGSVGLDEQFEVIANNGCAFVVEVREPGCTDETVAPDFDGCARLELQAGGADREGLPHVGGDGGTVELEWFDPAVPEVMATGTWRLEVERSSGGGWDSDSGGGRATRPDLIGNAVGRRCGCSTGTEGVPWMVGLFGLAALMRRRS